MTDFYIPQLKLSCTGVLISP